jgi:hypothetical protein
MDVVEFCLNTRLTSSERMARGLLKTGARSGVGAVIVLCLVCEGEPVGMSPRFLWPHVVGPFHGD